MMSTTWILAADAARARLFELPGKGEPRELTDFVHPPGRVPERELAADAQGRNLAAGRRDRSGANEPHTTPEQVEEARFARALVDELERGRTANRFDALCLVAPPRFLGRLREALPGPLERLVTRSVAKDLVSFDVAKVAAHVSD